MYNIRLNLIDEGRIFARTVTWDFIPTLGMAVQFNQSPERTRVMDVVFIASENKFLVVLEPEMNVNVTSMELHGWEIINKGQRIINRF